MKTSLPDLTTVPSAVPVTTHSAPSYESARAGFGLVWGTWTWFFIFSTVILGVTSFFDPWNWQLNYAFTGIMIVGAFISFARFGTLNGNIRYLWPAFILFFIGIISFAGSRVSGELLSYGAALVPIGFSAAACLLPSCRTDSRWALRLFTWCLFLLIGASLAAFVGGDLVSHQSMMIIIMAFAIGAVTRQKTLMAAALLSIAIYSLLRPSSTVIVATAVVILFSLVHRAKFIRAYYAGIIGAVFAITALNFAAMVDPNLLVPILEVERFLKTEILGTYTNADFRLGAIRGASYEFSQGSFLFGKFFSGSINAPEMDFYLPWWGDYEAPIHSDFSIILLHGGALGFTLFAGWLFGICLMFRNGAQLAALAGTPDIKRFFESALLCCLVVAIFISFNPVLQQLSQIMPFYTVVWLGAMARTALAKDLAGLNERPSVY